MRIALVINATAGSMSDDITPDAIREKVEAAGLVADPEVDESAGLTERMEAAASQPGIEAVVVAGGDGTIACAASLMAGRDIPLGLIPLGTMNLLAKDLGIPVDLDEAIDNIRDGQAKRIDLGEVNGHAFLTTSLLGMPTRMAKHREAQRGAIDGRGIGRFIGGLFRHTGRYPRLAVTLAIDGRDQPCRLRMLAVVNNDFVERPGRVLVRDPVDGGRLTLYVLEHLSLWLTIRLAFGFTIGDWRHLPGLKRYPFKDLKISSKPHSLRVMNDGEVRLIDAPLRYSIRPKSLIMIVPRA